MTFQLINECSLIRQLILKKKYPLALTSLVGKLYQVVKNKEIVSCKKYIHKMST